MLRGSNIHSGQHKYILVVYVYLFILVNKIFILNYYLIYMHQYIKVSSLNILVVVVLQSSDIHDDLISLIKRVFILFIFNLFETNIDEIF